MSIISIAGYIIVGIIIIGVFYKIRKDNREVIEE